MEIETLQNKRTDVSKITPGDWAHPRNMHGKGGMVGANGRYHVPSCDCTVYKS